ncbi:MAG: hypothetical protein ACJAVI_005979, partial [Candidatus Azotimanducaceae bacterium]
AAANTGAAANKVAARLFLTSALLETDLVMTFSLKVVTNG